MGLDELLRYSVRREFYQYPQRVHGQRLAVRRLPLTPFA
jgi:hypothetical protein